MLNSVVLPDPFGPIRPVMLPRVTSIVQSLSACTPPKALETPSVRSRAVMTRSWRPARPYSRPPSPAGPQGGQLLPRRRQDPPRQEDDHYQEQRAEDTLGHVRV